MNEPAIWTGTLDGRFVVTVIRTGPSTATLKVTDGDHVLIEEPTGLSYGAQWGPDVGDVEDWQERAMAVVDAHLKKGTQ